MKNRKLILLIAPILFFTSTLSAQESKPKMYRSQYAVLREKAIALMTRAQGTSADRVALLREKSAILGQTRGLEGQVMDDFLASYESRGPDKSLLLFVEGCDALAFTLQSVDSFIQTGDQRFIVLAKRGVDLMDSVERFF